MDVKSTLFSVAVSRDGKWIISGTGRGQVQVWNAESGEKVGEIRRHSDWVRAVDVSPDSTKIASGSDNRTVRVWSLSTSKQLLSPWKHDGWVFAVKFSPDGRLGIATATQKLFRIYDSRRGDNPVVDVPIKVTSDTTTPSPGRAMTNTSLQYLLARSSVSTRPLAQCFLNGPFTATNTTGSGPGGRGKRASAYKVLQSVGSLMMA